MSGNKLANRLLATFAAAAIIGPSFMYTVQPSNMANVRRLGEKRFEEPVGQGPHFKLPFVDKVDMIQTDLRTLHIPPFTVITVDNQQVTLNINFNYTVPKDSVNRLLYGVGKAGNTDIDANIIPVAKDRASRIFSQQNTTMISRNREDIEKEVQDKIFAAVKDQFGIEPHSLQIAEISYSNAFVTSNNEAVKEKNGERVKQAQAEQAVIKSEGEAKVAVQNARGESQTTVIVAEANKDAAKLKGEGQSALTKAGIEVFGSPEKYLDYLETKAALKWDGQRPRVEVGVPTPGQ